MKPAIHVIVEHLRGAVRPSTWEVFGFAGLLRDLTGLPVRGIVPGAADGMAEAVSRRTGAEITVLKNPLLSDYTGEAWKAALTAFFSAHPPAYVCAAHTSRGMDFMPGLAVRLGAACISAVREILADEPGRPAFGRAGSRGGRIDRVRPLTETVLLTVQPGCFSPPAPIAHHGPAVRVEPVSIAETRSRFIGIGSTQADTSALEAAEVIVSAGNGIGDAQTLDLIRELAAQIPASAVGASRIVCDRGWLPYGHQVGATGAAVSPKLYIACGISGAPQHLSGMAGSEIVVAINTDPRAAILNHADIGIVEDLKTFLPILIHFLKQTNPNPQT